MELPILFPRRDETCFTFENDIVKNRNFPVNLLRVNKIRDSVERVSAPGDEHVNVEPSQKDYTIIFDFGVGDKEVWHFKSEDRRFETLLEISRIYGQKV